MEGRRFVVRILNFDNGNFIAVTEGGIRIGSMVASICTGPTPVTTTVIPAKSESFFLKLIAEQVSSTMKGISIVSASIKGDLDNKSAKALMNTIMEMIKAV